MSTTYRHYPVRAVLIVLAVARLCYSEATEVQRRFFEQRIQPILVQHCYECHSQDAQQVEGGLLLDSREGLLHGGDSGPAVVAGDVTSSVLMQAIRYEDLEMPPAGQLPAEVIHDFAKWIEMGAPDPRSKAEVERESDFEEARKYWAFQPVSSPRVPRVQDMAWPATPIDNFILAELERRQLHPALPTSRSQYIRRVYFDLTGLPPEPDVVRNFVESASPTAYEDLVDRLLASPQYGERWSQHWLDLVRYAETEGFEYDRIMSGAWRYRDYVIASFNADKPYDEFVTEQLAGDELASPAGTAYDQTLRIAAGLHRLGAIRRNAGNQKVASSRNEVLTERTDIVGAVFMGLTVGCARCHDHKFDPIPQRDYYRLQAFFAGSQEENMVLASDDEQASWQQTKDDIDAQIAKLTGLLKNTKGPEQDAIRVQIAELEAKLPHPLPTICSIRNHSETLSPTYVLKRGNPEQPGVEVGMRPLGVLTSESWPELDYQTSTPRTHLANWLTDPSHPLTARVIVNRVWQFHFGRGLVRTANDFGRNGAPPSHPELLDWLASKFVEGEQQLKVLHRLIVLSSTYRQASTSSASARASLVDPDNALLWRFSRRRLSAEELRDAMLCLAGNLQFDMYGPSVILPVDEQLVQQLYKTSQWEVTHVPSELHRRSIYLLAKRNLRLPFMEVFDQPAAQTSCANREQSTHPPQALELLNGRMSNQFADAFAARLTADVGHRVPQQVEHAFWLAAGRAPNADERALAESFVRTVSLREFALAMFNLNAFLYVD